MIEQTIYEYLKSEFEGSGVDVFMQVPDQNPAPDYRAPFIVIEKTGSSVENWIAESTFAIQSYAATLFEAASLSEQVVKTMFGAIAMDDITRVELNSEYNFTDTETRRPRYQAVFDITHYCGYQEG
jgi:hypothetical protein